VRKLSSEPDELRDQLVASLALEPRTSTLLTFRGGVGRTRNLMFTGGRRHDWVADLGVRKRL
jgi:hypothetical protein